MPLLATLAVTVTGSARGYFGSGERGALDCDIGYGPDPALPWGPVPRTTEAGWVGDGRTAGVDDDAVGDTVGIALAAVLKGQDEGIGIGLGGKG